MILHSKLSIDNSDRSSMTYKLVENSIGAGSVAAHCMAIYRVRTREHISQRTAVDMQRDVHITRQKCTITTLHHHRTGQMSKAG